MATLTRWHQQAMHFVESRIWILWGLGLLILYIWPFMWLKDICYIKDTQTFVTPKIFRRYFFLLNKGETLPPKGFKPKLTPWQSQTCQLTKGSLALLKVLRFISWQNYFTGQLSYQRFLFIQNHCMKPDQGIKLVFSFPASLFSVTKHSDVWRISKFWQLPRLFFVGPLGAYWSGKGFSSS